MHGGCRQQQEVLFLQILHRAQDAPVLRIVQTMSLIQNHEVVAMAQHLFDMQSLLRYPVWYDQARTLPCQTGINISPEYQENFVKLFIEFTLPLAEQLYRAENEDSRREPTQYQLFQNNASLNRLPQSDLVSEQYAPSHLPEGFVGSFPLMRQFADRRERL